MDIVKIFTAGNGFVKSFIQVIHEDVFGSHQKV